MKSSLNLRSTQSQHSAQQATQNSCSKCGAKSVATIFFLPNCNRHPICASCATSQSKGAASGVADCLQCKSISSRSGSAAPRRNDSRDLSIQQVQGNENNITGSSQISGMSLHEKLTEKILEMTPKRKISSATSTERIKQFTNNNASSTQIYSAIAVVAAATPPATTATTITSSSSSSSLQTTTRLFNQFGMNQSSPATATITTTPSKCIEKSQQQLGMLIPSQSQKQQQQSGESQQQHQQVTTMNCTEHNDSFSLFCETEKRLCCVECVYTHHGCNAKSHTVIPLKQSMHLIKHEIETFKLRAHEKFISVDESIRTTNALLHSLNGRSSACVDFLVKEFASINHALAERQESLLQELNGFFSMKIAKVEETQRILGDVKRSVKEFRELESASKKGDIHSCVRVYSMQQNMMKKQLKQFDAITSLNHTISFGGSAGTTAIGAPATCGFSIASLHTHSFEGGSGNCCSAEDAIVFETKAKLLNEIASFGKVQKIIQQGLQQQQQQQQQHTGKSNSQNNNNNNTEQSIHSSVAASGSNNSSIAALSTGQQNHPQIIPSLSSSSAQSLLNLIPPRLTRGAANGSSGNCSSTAGGLSQSSSSQAISKNNSVNGLNASNVSNSFTTTTPTTATSASGAAKKLQSITSVRKTSSSEYKQSTPSNIKPVSVSSSYQLFRAGGNINSRSKENSIIAQQGEKNGQNLFEKRSSSDNNSESQETHCVKSSMQLSSLGKEKELESASMELASSQHQLTGRERSNRSKFDRGEKDSEYLSKNMYNPTQLIPVRHHQLSLISASGAARSNSQESKLTILTEEEPNYFEQSYSQNQLSQQPLSKQSLCISQKPPLIMKTSVKNLLTQQQQQQQPNQQQCEKGTGGARSIVQTQNGTVSPAGKEEVMNYSILRNKAMPSSSTSSSSKMSVMNSSNNNDSKLSLQAQIQLLTKDISQQSQEQQSKSRFILRNEKENLVQQQQLLSSQHHNLNSGLLEARKDSENMMQLNGKKQHTSNHTGGKGTSGTGKQQYLPSFKEQVNDNSSLNLSGRRGAVKGNGGNSESAKKLADLQVQRGVGEVSSCSQQASSMVIETSSYGSNLSEPAKEIQEQGVARGACDDELNQTSLSNWSIPADTLVCSTLRNDDHDYQMQQEMLNEVYRNQEGKLSKKESSQFRQTEVGISRCFKDSEILNREMEQILLGLVPLDIDTAKILLQKKGECLGESIAEEFHAKCDGQGACLLLIWANNCVFGCYSPVAFAKNEKYVTSSTSFIFSILKHGELSPALFPVRTDKRFIAIYQSPSSVCFGSTLHSKQDLVINLEDVSKSASAIGYAYQNDETPGGKDGNGHSVLAGSYSDWDVQAIEVFSIHLKKEQ